MQIPIFNGVFTDERSDFRIAYPRNLVPVSQAHGISAGYLRPADGIVELAEGPGIDRGAINWDGTCYRVMGTKLVSVASDGTVTTLGDVGGAGQVSFDYSFDRLAIASGGNLFYWDGATLTQVTDPDLLTVVDVLWIDGYFMTTDGEFLVVTELTDPLSVNPLHYGSSEVDPDPVVALLKLRNEVYALNRHTIEAFDNVGGDFFPFDRIEGAQLTRGCVGTHACAVFLESIAFLGSGRNGEDNEPVSVWLGLSGTTQKIATREIDLILQEYTEAQLSQAVMETRVESGHEQLRIRLPDRTLVFDAATTRDLKQPVWHVLTTSLVGNAQYRAINPTFCYNRWIVGDPQQARLGVYTSDVSSHWGEINGWEFQTAIVYNESRGAIFHELELVALTGRVALGADPTIWASYSVDGETYSQEKPIKVGKVGNRTKRLVWWRQGYMCHWRLQRFRGNSDAHASFARLEARLEPLAV